MPKAPRMLWLVVLVLFAGGCSGMRPARWSDSPTDAEDPDRALPVARIGDRVTVERLDGSRLSGRLGAITGDSVSITTAHKVGYVWERETQVVPRSEIRSVRKSTFSIKRTLATSAIVVVGLGVAFAASLDGSDWRVAE